MESQLRARKKVDHIYIYQYTDAHSYKNIQRIFDKSEGKGIFRVIKPYRKLTKKK